MRIGAHRLATGIFAVAIVMISSRGIANEERTSGNPWLNARTVSLGKIRPGQLDHRFRGSLQFDFGLRASPGLTRLAQLVTRHGKAVLVIDGVESRPYDDPWQLPYYESVFSPDSRHFAYWARLFNEHVLFIDGVEQRAYTQPASQDRDELLFSPDGKKLVFPMSDSLHILDLALDADLHLRVVADRLMGQAWSGEPIAFTADSRHLIHLLSGYFHYPQVYAVDESIVPGSPRKSHRNDDIHQIDINFRLRCSDVLVGSNRFSFLAVRHSEVFRVDVEIANSPPLPFSSGRAGIGDRPGSTR